MNFPPLYFGFRRLSFSMLIVLATSTLAVAQSFVHPGCLSTQADLNRMAAKVAANAQPWKAGYDRLVAAPYGQLGHTPSPQVTLYASGSQPDNYINLARDVAAAYQCALRYHVTGDEQYAAKAVSILMLWANTHTGWDGNTNVSLRAGLYGYQLACAGELVRNYSGWSPTDFAKFQNYVRTQFYHIVSPNAIDRGFLFHHHGTTWSHYWANWELAAMATVIATGVLCDDRTIFNEAIDYFHNGVGVGRISELLYHLHPNGLGQSQEFGRDQGHASMLVPLLGTFCEIAWNQGVDLYSELDNAFLAMSENLSKYNLWYDVPYVTYINSDYLVLTNIGSSSRGTIRAGAELVYNHYVNRMGMSAPYTKEAAEAIRPEGGGGQYGSDSGGYDQLGFTTLTHTLDPIATGALPSKLRAVVQGGKLTLSWRGSAYAKSYNVKRSVAPGGPYINLARVGPKNTYYVDTGLPPGTTCYYVVSANNPGGESANSAEISATNDGQLYGTLIGTTGSAGNWGATREVAMDGCLKNYMDAWASDGGWVGLDLGSNVSALVTGIKYCPQPGGGSRLLGCKVQGSNTADFSNGVVDLCTVASAPPEGVFTTQSFSNGNAFRYVRFHAPANTYCTAGEVQFIGNARGMTPPAVPPSGLTVSSSGQGQVSLLWNSVSDATDYVIKRATTSGGPYTVLEYNSPWDMDYTDRGLSQGTYYYVVSAINSMGETVNSGEQSIQITANVAPGSTTSANAGSGSGTEGSDKAIDGNVNTKWYTGGGYSSAWLQIDLGAGNAQIVTRYDITSANDVPNRDPKTWQLLGSNNGTTWTTLDTRVGETFSSRFQTRQYSLTNTKAYRYFKLNILSNLSANSADGIQLSELALISQGPEPAPSDPTPPAAPAGVMATGGDGVVTLDWADNTEPDVASYTIKRATASGGPYTIIASGLTFSSYSDATVTNGTTYYYVVTATDTSLNQSSNSIQVVGAPQTPPPASAPTGLTATQVSTSRIDLAWNPASGAGSYTVKRATKSGGPYDILAENLTTTSYIDTTVSPRIDYYYVVVGVNGAGAGAVSSEASIRIDDLHLWLKFDESGGATAADSSGNGRNATLVNGPVFASGKIGNALVFASSASRYASLPAGLVSTLGDFTVCAWVKPTTLNTWARVFDFGSGTSTNMFLTAMSGANGGKPRFAIKISNSAEQGIDSAVAMSPGVWTHLAVTLSGSTGTLYVNGVAVGTNSAMTFQPSGMGSTTQNYLGKSQYSDPYFNGALDDFRIYRSALSADEIAALAAGPPAAPQNVTAVGGPAQIALSWGAVTNATSYVIRRASSGGGSYGTIASGVGGTGYTDFGLADATTWFYTVAAQGLAGEGAASLPVSATTYTAVQSWRQANFGTISNSGDAADDADPDGDGMANAQEFAAGTNPNNAGSALRVNGVTISGNDVLVSFASVAGKTYRLERSDTLQSGSWSTVQDNIAGTGAVLQITDVGAATQSRRFYRVVVP
jgi:fibronectin type 3 domain-containing protein